MGTATPYSSSVASVGELADDGEVIHLSTGGQRKTLEVWKLRKRRNGLEAIELCERRQIPQAAIRDTQDFEGRARLQVAEGGLVRVQRQARELLET